MSESLGNPPEAQKTLDPNQSFKETNNPKVGEMGSILFCRRNKNKEGESNKEKQKL